MESSPPRPRFVTLGSAESGKKILNICELGFKGLGCVSLRVSGLWIWDI